ncbi:MAG: PTS sugar transporter subunit IIA [Alphaproteobacteria bacterium]|nr:PTS sugar transporter subunit IIA [Alphaproteobacteria bacterium]MDE2042887.1 PTS sugar transporter subunit IIA [Alphaproteobacteria bacterium]
MHNLNAYLSPKAVRVGLQVSNKRALLHQLASLGASAFGIADETIFDCLHERERLGSTGFGAGIALPHGKLDGLKHVVAACVTLDKPVDFEAVDDMPVDLVMMLLSPADGGAQHLKALASVSRAMRDARLVSNLRGATTDEALFALFDTQEIPHAA